MSILATVLAVVASLMKYAPLATQIVKTGMDLKPFAIDLYKQLKGEELTADERTELETSVDALFAQFMRPQSPAQPGDPDYVSPVT